MTRGALCPFCEGNEAQTAPEVFALRTSETAADTPGWSVRVIPNKFPALRARVSPLIGVTPPFEEAPAIGSHEVVVDTPEHNSRMARFSIDRFETILTVYQARVRALGALPDVKSIALFRNDGRAAGASQVHPHSQIIAMPVVPTRLRNELEEVERHYRARGCCPTCEMLDCEREHHRRLIVRNAHFVAVTSWAARYPYESWIVPSTHHHDFRECDPRAIRGLAEILSEVLQTLESVVGEFPYNLILQTAPVDDQGPRPQGFHWRLEILPRSSVPSGLELGCDVFIVSVSPEDAAARLRAAVKTEPGCTTGASLGA